MAITSKSGQSEVDAKVKAAKVEAMKKIKAAYLKAQKSGNVVTYQIEKPRFIR